MRYERDGYSVEAALAKGRELPEWFLDEPPKGPLDDFYLEAFWVLSSTRYFDRGPIPWNIIVEYGCYHGLATDIMKAFVTIISAMDASFIKWVSTQKTGPIDPGQ